MLVSFPFLLEKENRGLENHWRLLRLSVASFLTLRVSFFAHCSKMTLTQGALTHVCKVSSGLFRIRGTLVVVGLVGFLLSASPEFYNFAPASLPWWKALEKIWNFGMKPGALSGGSQRVSVEITSFVGRVTIMSAARTYLVAEYLWKILKKIFHSVDRGYFLKPGLCSHNSDRSWSPNSHCEESTVCTGRLDWVFFDRSKLNVGSGL